ncbi:MAG: DUF4230 domain-containing protein [Verrucomicrobiae bacterium]|nr:DUF4230 domain-containing protein [Verrucomicrobiae bacterium]
MSENEIVSPESRPGQSGQVSPMSPWARVFWLFVVLVIAGLIVFGGFVWIAGRTFDSVEKGMESTKDTFVGIAAAFRPETISETFSEFTELTAKGNEGNILEVVTAEATEEFTRKTNVVWFDREVPLGTTVSEISVPATYRYHIDLSGDWSLSAYDGRVTVVAPSLQPSLPVAFDSGRMRKKTKSGWGRWDGNENLGDLERSLTSRLEERAKSPETIDRVREEARMSVAGFVRNWLLAREHWSDSTYREIVVVFEDELGSPTLGNLTDRPASLRWEPQEPTTQVDSEPVLP